jgi:hypothetical protein
MNKRKAESFLHSAKRYMVENHRNELRRAMKDKRFRDISPNQFLEMYCWVVYASNFSVKTLEEKWPKIKKAFKGFSISRIARMRSIRPVLSVFNNVQKARCFLRGVQGIYSERFRSFIKRVEGAGMTSLEDLPGVGPITKKHLARNTGSADVAKDDVNIRSLVELLGGRDENELVGYLAKKFDERKGVVDAILWRFCADRGWKDEGYDSLKTYMNAL